ncbi:hypothetical protein RAS1_20840 [Phycisphaerae bacterium RAS1]|nr:hypothetical protein RAS1_20840 [Phycisphaerae bacterium RAS1]
MPASRKYLKPEVVARLRGLELRSRRAVTGVLSGMHRSVYHGYSVEFAEHRPYVAGDDLRHIDWRLFGRKDRFFIKQYEEETNLRCNFLLDTSSSMAFGGGGVSKFEYAAALAASMAYLVSEQHDAIGLITFDSRVRTNLPETTGHQQLLNFLALLDDAAPEGQTDVKMLFHRLAEQLRRRSVVVLISDLLADIDAVADGLEHLCHTGHELIVFHTLDPSEWDFPFVENVMFEGLEDELRLLADPQALRASYMAAVERFCTRVKTVCLKHRADYVAVNTRDPVEVVLSGYLSRRAGAAAPPARGTAGGGGRS